MDDKDQNTGHGARKGFPWQPCLAGNANHRDHKWMASSYEQDPPPWLKSCFYSLLPNGHLPLIFSNSLVQLLSCVQLFATPWTAAHQASLSINNSQSLLKLMSIESVMPYNHLILSSPSPPAFRLSQHQGLFQGVSSSHQVDKVLELQLQHQSFQCIFRTDFL